MFTFIFNKTYFFLFSLLLIIEIVIALYLHDSIIRPYIGDLLVVIMIYCFCKTFYNGSVIITCISVLLFAYGIEISQYFKLINYLALQHSKIANIIIGHSFGWIDMLAYTAGIAIVLLGERYKLTGLQKKVSRQQQHKAK